MPGDHYALLALGNIFYAAKFEKKDKEDKYMKLAMDYYWRVMKDDPQNIYAANGPHFSHSIFSIASVSDSSSFFPYADASSGLGIVLAERGHLRQAQDAFMKVWYSSIYLMETITEINTIQRERESYILT